MNINKGFTLIEILIVLVIIGITIGFAIIAFGDFGASRRILFSAEQLANALKLAQQQAILEGSTLGLRIDSQSYQILKFQAPSQWKPMTNKGVFKITYFPENTYVQLKENTLLPQNIPAIIINSTGDITPFTLMFGSSKDIILTTLTVTSNGMILFKNNHSK